MPNETGGESGSCSSVTPPTAKGTERQKQHRRNAEKSLGGNNKQSNNKGGGAKRSSQKQARGGQNHSSNGDGQRSATTATPQQHGQAACEEGGHPFPPAPSSSVVTADHSTVDHQQQLQQKITAQQQIWRQQQGSSLAVGSGVETQQQQHQRQMSASSSPSQYVYAPPPPTAFGAHHGAQSQQHSPSSRPQIAAYPGATPQMLYPPTLVYGPPPPHAYGATTPYSASTPEAAAAAHQYWATARNVNAAAAVVAGSQPPGIMGPPQGTPYAHAQQQMHGVSPAGAATHAQQQNDSNASSSRHTPQPPATSSQNSYSQQQNSIQRSPASVASASHDDSLEENIGGGISSATAAAATGIRPISRQNQHLQQQHQQQQFLQQHAQQLLHPQFPQHYQVRYPSMLPTGHAASVASTATMGQQPPPFQLPPAAMGPPFSHQQQSAQMQPQTHHLQQQQQQQHIQPHHPSFQNAHPGGGMYFAPPPPPLSSAMPLPAPPQTLQLHSAARGQPPPPPTAVPLGQHTQPPLPHLLHHPQNQHQHLHSVPPPPAASIHPGLKVAQREAVDKLMLQFANPKQQPLTADLLYERRLFFEKLVMLNEQHGELLSGPPNVSKSPVDLHALYYAVKQRGGFEKTIRDKIWKNLCTDANMDMQQSSAAGFQLRKHYQKFLLRLECLETSKNFDELIEFAEKQKKKKKEKEKEGSKVAASAAAGPGTPSPTTTSSSAAASSKEEQKALDQRQQHQQRHAGQQLLNGPVPGFPQGFPIGAPFQPSAAATSSSHEYPVGGCYPAPQQFPGGQYPPTAQWAAYQQQMYLHQQRMRCQAVPVSSSASASSAAVYAQSGTQQTVDDEAQQSQQRRVTSSSSRLSSNSTPAPADSQQSRASSASGLSTQQHQNDATKRVATVEDAEQRDASKGAAGQQRPSSTATALSANAPTPPLTYASTASSAAIPSSSASFYHTPPPASVFGRYPPGAVPPPPPPPPPPSSSEQQLYGAGMYAGLAGTTQQIPVWATPSYGAQNAVSARFPLSSGTPISARYTHTAQQVSSSNSPQQQQILAAATSASGAQQQSTGKHSSKRGAAVAAGRGGGGTGVVMPVEPPTGGFANVVPPPPQQFPAWFGASTMTTQQSPFPPHSLEAQAIAHLLQQQQQQHRYRRPKVYARDLTGVTPARIVMALRSTLHLEAIWALNALNIQLYDDTTPNAHPSLTQTPELLNLLVEHFTAVLALLFPTHFNAKSLRFSTKAAAASASTAEKTAPPSSFSLPSLPLIDFHAKRENSSGNIPHQDAQFEKEENDMKKQQKQRGNELVTLMVRPPPTFSTAFPSLSSSSSSSPSSTTINTFIAHTNNGITVADIAPLPPLPPSNQHQQQQQKQPNFTLVSRLGRQVRLDTTAEIPTDLARQLREVEKINNEEEEEEKASGKIFTSEEKNEPASELQSSRCASSFSTRIQRSLFENVCSRLEFTKLAPRFIRRIGTTTGEASESDEEEDAYESGEEEEEEEEIRGKKEVGSVARFVKKECQETEKGEQMGREKEEEEEEEEKSVPPPPTSSSSTPLFFRRALPWERWDRHCMDECSLVSRAPVLCSKRTCPITGELIDRCLALSNILRGFSFLGEQKALAQHGGLLRVLASLLMLRCSDQSRKRGAGKCPRHFSFPRPPPEEELNKNDELSETKSNTGGSANNINSSASVPAEQDSRAKWLLEVANQLRDDAFTILSHISPQLDLYEVESSISLPLFDALLHWSVCTDLAARDTLPPFGAVSPRHLVLETLCKMSVLERNVDLLLATGPWPRLEEFVRQLCALICEEPPVREFAIVILNALCSASEPVCLVATTETALLDHLVAFLEAADANMTQIAQHQGIHTLRENPEVIGTSVGMLRRASLIMTHIVRHQRCRSHFHRLQHRLLQLTVSHFMDSRVAAMVADILFEMQRGSSDAHADEHSLPASFRKKASSTTTTATIISATKQRPKKEEEEEEEEEEEKIEGEEEEEERGNKKQQQPGRHSSSSSSSLQKQEKKENDGEKDDLGQNNYDDYDKVSDGGVCVGEDGETVSTPSNNTNGDERQQQESVGGREREEEEEEEEEEKEKKEEGTCSSDERQQNGGVGCGSNYYCCNDVVEDGDVGDDDDGECGEVGDGGGGSGGDIGPELVRDGREEEMVEKLAPIPSTHQSSTAMPFELATAPSSSSSSQSFGPVTSAELQFNGCDDGPPAKKKALEAAKEMANNNNKNNNINSTTNNTNTNNNDEIDNVNFNTNCDNTNNQPNNNNKNNNINNNTSSTTTNNNNNKTARPLLFPLSPSAFSSKKRCVVLPLQM